ncbi:MAG: DUF4127 family protein [bacterium]
MLLYLPLDDRPPNLFFVVLLAAMAGQSLCIWPRYDNGAARWATTSPARTDLASLVVSNQTGTPLISLNALAAGGLVGSRRIDARTLGVPHLPSTGLYLFVVPRIEPTSQDDATKEAYHDLRNALGDQVTQLKVVDVLTGKEPVTSLGDPHLRDWVGRTEGWFRWLEACQIPQDRLLVLMDDNRPGPLGDYIRERYGWLSSSVIDGADEGGLLLYARALWEERGRPPLELGLLYSSPGRTHDRGRYEGLPLDEVLARQAAWLGVRLVPVAETAKTTPVLLIHNWDVKQGDRHDVNEWNPNPLGDDIPDLLRRVEGRAVGIADIAYANGGDPVFAVPIHEAWKAGELDLRAYAGWNTAANSLGSALALLVVDQLTEETPKENQIRDEFITARFLDDVVYQSDLRQEMEATLRDRHADPWHLNEVQLAGLETTMTQRLLDEAVTDGYLAIPEQWGLHLPWQRTFEASITTPWLRQVFRDTQECD